MTSTTEGTAEVKQAIRGKCAEGLETLKLEWARYELARQWIDACELCHGWIMIIDTRDVFFQAHPFIDLPSSADLIFVEEISPQTCPINDPDRSFVAGNPRSYSHVNPCYGNDAVIPYKSRPVLNSGTVLGTRAGIARFLRVLIHEFHENNGKSNTACRSPSTTDQWTMNYLYYHGKFGFYDRTMTMPWGHGPVLTAGKACMSKDRRPGAADIVPRDSLGRLLNLHDRRVAPVIHQYDRCHQWIEPYLAQLYPNMY